MKRLLITISLIITFFGLLLTATPFLLRKTGLDESFKRYVLSAIIVESEGKIDFGNFQIGFGKFRINEVLLDFKEEKFQLNLQSIEFSFDFFNLLSNLRRPDKAIDAVYIRNADLIIFSSEQDSQLTLPTGKLTNQQIKEIFTNIGKLSNIEKIMISNSSIRWQNGQQRIYSIVENLNGWLIARSLDEVTLEARGKMFSADKDNFYIDSKINFEENNLDMIILLDKYDLTKLDVPFLPEEIILTGGTIGGSFHILINDFLLDQASINGELAIENLNFDMLSYSFSNIDLWVDINENKAEIINGDGQFAEADFFMEGMISNVLKPEPKFEISLSHLALSHFESDLKTDLFNQASLNAHLLLEYKNGHPGANVQLWAEHLDLGERARIDDFKGSLTWQTDHVILNDLSGEFGNFNFHSTGEYQPSEKILSLKVKGNHQFGEHILFDRLSDKEIHLAFNLLLNIDEMHLNGNWRYQIGSPEDTLITAFGDLLGKDNQLSVSLLRSNIDKFSAQLQIADFFQNPVINNAQIENFPITVFTSNAMLIAALERYNTKFELQGALQSLRGKVYVNDRDNSENRFELNMQIANLLHPRRQVNGEVTVKNLNGRYSFTQSEDFLNGTFNFGNEIRGLITIDFKDEEQVSGMIDFNKFKLLRAFSDANATDDMINQAEINGSVFLSGDINDPRVKADLFADKFVINNIGYYQAEIHLQSDSSKIFADTVVIYLNNLPIMNGALTYKIQDHSITSHLSGTNIDIEPLLATVDPESRLLKGIADFDVQINGILQKPAIAAKLSVVNGEIATIEFDKMDLEIIDSVKTTGRFENLQDHILSVENAELIRTGKYQLQVNGNLPLNANDSLSVHGEFWGDLFAFIPKLNPFFVDGTCVSDMQFSLGGTTNRPKLQGGSINIERGELWLAKVASHIKNIHGRIEMQEGTNQVNFVNLNAAIDDANLKINTVRDISLDDGRHLENWYFKGTDLDFGILQLETSERGVAVNIPGLMTEGDLAQLHLTGAPGEPYFYFAGPVRNPRLRGTVTLFNTRFTFPFVTQGTTNKEPSVVVEFLENIYWDIWVHSGQDVIYFRDIPAYFDKVYTELYIDEASQGIHFLGTLRKNTFHPIGQVISSRGRLEYLDTNFRVEQFAVEFTPNEIYPYVSGRAWTAVRDSVGAIPKTIYLQLYARDAETNEEKRQGRWEDFKFKLVSADPQIGETQEQVLAYLGFSVDNIREKATSVGGAVTERYLIRPILRPIERLMEKSFGVDLVRINSNIAKNLFYTSLGSEYRNKPFIDPFSTESPYLFLMQSSELTVGKYLSQNLYLTYTGQLVSFYDQAQTSFDLNHSLGLEYRLLRNVLLEFEYDRELMGFYRIPNQKQYFEDFKIRLRHSFAF